MKMKQCIVTLFLLVPLSVFAGTAYVDVYVIDYPGEKAVMSVTSTDTQTQVTINGCTITVQEGVMMKMTGACKNFSYRKMDTPAPQTINGDGIAIINTINGDLNMNFK